MPQDDIKTEIGKYLSYILRHRPDAVGIQLDSHGYADVAELLKGMRLKYAIDIDLLEIIVNEDSKNRFSFSRDKSLIRANQGHSIKVDLDLIPVMPPQTLYHGTGARYVDSILVEGLVSKSRQYVHLSEKIDTAIEVGRRHGKPVVFW